MCRQLPSCSLFHVLMYKNRKFIERNYLHISEIIALLFIYHT